MTIQCVSEDAARRRPLLAVALAATVGALLIAGCGEDENDDGGDAVDAQQLTLTVTEPGQIEAPPTAEAGVAEITLENPGGRPADAQLIRVEGDHAAAEVIDGLAAALGGKSFPDWFFAGGGVGATEAGSQRTVTQTLLPGTYYAFDTRGLQGPPDPAAVATIEVSGEELDAELPASEATVSAFDYGFEAEGLSAGANEITFENAGEQPHHLIAMPIAEGRTIDDVAEFLETEMGEPPIDAAREVATAVVEGGQTQLVELDLDQGNYALLCFISDRAGGPPHVVNGMVAETEVAG